MRGISWFLLLLVARHLPRAVASRLVWAALERQPGFNEALRQGEAELAAGRGVRYRVEDL